MDFNPENFINSYIEELSKYATNLDEDFFAEFVRKNNINYGNILKFFPDGQNDIIRNIFEKWNTASYKRYNDENLRFSQKIESILQIKMAVAAEKHLLFKNIFRYLSKPKQYKLAIELAKSDVNGILSKAKDYSTDIKYYTKRASLMAVYISCMVYLLRNKDANKINSFVHNRIQNILTFTKTKNSVIASIKGIFSGK